MVANPIDAPPKVSVGILTYNQADFIRQAIDSVLAQRTDFPVEILVHDDCSTDGTREIVESYVAAHPGHVRAILQAENQFSQGRRIFPILLPQMRGDYIALLDGDDFWQADGKLQAQGDFLDAHPGCVMCHTKTVLFIEATQQVETILPSRRRRSLRHDGADLAKGNFIQPSAVMFRADAVPEFPAAFHALPFGDYALFGLLSQAGWIGLIDEEMATRRIHDANFWAGQPLNQRVEATREVIRFLAQHLAPEHRQPWIDAAAAPMPSETAFALARLRRRLSPVRRFLRRVFAIKPR